MQTSAKYAAEKFFKYHTIRAAAQLFSLDEKSEETLANKAGLSMQAEPLFHTLLLNEIKERSSSKKIYIHAQLSERMFQYIKNGKSPTKESLLALMISLGMDKEEISALLPKAGYVLSNSIARDLVVKELLSDRRIMQDHTQAVFHINQTLYELELPLLMTRTKKYSG